MDITFADLLTAAGAGIAAGIITGVVELIKRVFPAIDARVTGAVMAFFLSAILYVLAAVSTGVASLDGGLGVFLAWLACATASVGIHSTIEHVSGNSG